MPKRTSTSNVVTRILRVLNAPHVLVEFQSMNWQDATQQMAFKAHDPGNNANPGPVIFETPPAGKTLLAVQEEILNGIHDAQEIIAGSRVEWIDRVEIDVDIVDSALTPRFCVRLIGDQSPVADDAKVKFAEVQNDFSPGPPTTSEVDVTALTGADFIEVSIPEHVSLSVDSIEGSFHVIPEVPDQATPVGPVAPTPTFQESNTNWITTKTVLEKPESTLSYLPTTVVVPPGTEVLFNALVERDTRWFKVRTFNLPT